MSPYVGPRGGSAFTLMSWMNCASMAGSSRTVSFAWTHRRCALRSVSWKRSDNPVRRVSPGLPELSSSPSSMSSSLGLFPERPDSVGATSASILAGASDSGAMLSKADARMSGVLLLLFLLSDCTFALYKMFLGPVSAQCVAGGGKPVVEVTHRAGRKKEYQGHHEDRSDQSECGSCAWCE
eukprot:1180008-Prorocentrum_minimum.AAC.2